MRRYVGLLDQLRPSHVRLIEMNEGDRPVSRWCIPQRGTEHLLGIFRV
jgi:hypothetical protein